MLLRRIDSGVIAIGQASHAWLSGQLARAWGNERFGRVEPYEEVCLAAEQHDLGMARADLAPALNPSTGLPYSFLEMPLHAHMQLWSAAAPRLLSQSRYAALLVAMHGRRLYERRKLDELSQADSAAVRRFLAAQREFEAHAVASLHADPTTRAAATPELVARNSQLVWTWDYMSLALCLDWTPSAARAVPTATGSVDLQLAPVAPGTVAVEPWPFDAATVTVRCEGRRLAGGYSNDSELATAWRDAAWEMVPIELVPAG